MSDQGFLTALERKEFLALVPAQRGSHGVARRAHAILLLDKGWSFEAVADALFISTSSAAHGTRLSRLVALNVYRSLPGTAAEVI